MKGDHQPTVLMIAPEQCATCGKPVIFVPGKVQARTGKWLDGHYRHARTS